MKVLALETSTQAGSVAVIIDGHVVAEETSLRQRSHSEIINPFVQACLAKAGLEIQDMDLFAVGEGPGSFTGIRVAGNAGKSFAYSHNKPLVAIDSLTLLAQQARHESAGRPVLAILNAYKNMVYLGLLDVQDPHQEPRYLVGPSAVPVRELSQHIDQDCLVVGDGWDAYHEYFPEPVTRRLFRLPTLLDLPFARTLGLMAEVRGKKQQTLDWNSFIPLYIRASEAEETKKGILISPLK